MTTTDKDEFELERITPWYILDLLKPIIKDELIAKCRSDRTGVRIAFPNGQKFHLSIKEIKEAD